MKEISIVCKPNGIAILSTSDIHSNTENNASQLKIDFTECTDYLGENKWVDIVCSDGTSLRYDLGTDDIVYKSLEYADTIEGELKITPFIYNGLAIKAKYKTNKSILIYKVAESGSQSAIQRDDYVFEMKENVDSFTTFKDKFVFCTESEFEVITRLSDKIYGVYDEISGVIIWYYGDI
jgi:hypothetical protein